MKTSSNYLKPRPVNPPPWGQAEPLKNVKPLKWKVHHRNIFFDQTAFQAGLWIYFQVKVSSTGCWDKALKGREQPGRGDEAFRFSEAERSLQHDWQWMELFCHMERLMDDSIWILINLFYSS